MMKLPPPATFAEGMRWLFSLCAIIAGICIGVGLIGLVSILVWGGWPAERFEQIITILGWVAIGGLGLMAAVLIGMLVGGPVGRFKGSAGKDGVSLEASAGEHPVPVEVVNKPSEPVPVKEKRDAEPLP